MMTTTTTRIVPVVVNDRLTLASESQEYHLVLAAAAAVVVVVVVVNEIARFLSSLRAVNRPFERSSNRENKNLLPLAFPFVVLSKNSTRAVQKH
jgi:hypothetical protein